MIEVQKFTSKRKTATVDFEEINKKKLIYVSHPFGGITSNLAKIENIIVKLQKKYPKAVFISPVHCFGFMYHTLSYEDGLDKCISLLAKCDSMIDCDRFRTSKGCAFERKYCIKHHKKLYRLYDVLPISPKNTTPPPQPVLENTENLEEKSKLEIKILKNAEKIRNSLNK